MSLPLNGTSQCMYAADAAALAIARPWTICGWFKQTTAAVNSNRRLFEWGGYGVNSSLLAFLRASNGSLPDQMQAYVRDAGSDVLNVINGSAFGDDTAWHHWAVTCTTGSLLTHYVDGVASGTGTNAACDGVDRTGLETLTDYVFGADGAKTAYFFPGKLAEFAKYDAVLTPTEIADLAAGAVPGTYTPAWWLPLYSDKESVAGSLTTTLVGSPSAFDTADHPVSYANPAITEYSVKAWSVKPITDTRTVPTTTGGTLSLAGRGCVGQYVPLSFCLRTTSEATIELSTDWTSGPTIDLKWVKCWWQNPNPWHTHWYTPVLYGELLLNDLDFVAVSDATTKTNTIREPIADEATLQPTTLAANFTQQVWVEWYIPAGTAAGTYTANVVVQVTRGETVNSFNVPISLVVLPFTLSASPIEYGMYYQGRLYGTDAIYANPKTAAQYASDCTVMAAHGVTHPTCYDDLAILWQNEERLANLDVLMQARIDAGLSVEPFYIINHALTVGSGYTTEEGQTNTTSLKAALAPYGVTNLYCMGVDEPSEAAMPAEATRLRTIQVVAKTWTAVSQRDDEALELMTDDELGSALDLVLTSTTSPDVAAWKATGARIGYYDNSYYMPLDTYYRRAFGLTIYSKGFDAVSSFAFQARFGDSWWDDTDMTPIGDISYPDHCYVYPTSGDDGVVSVNLKGYREATYDVRYAKTLVEHAGSVPDPTGLDMDDVRSAMIDAIIALRRPCIVLT